MPFAHAKWFVPDPGGYELDLRFLMSPWTLLPLLGICAGVMLAWSRRPERAPDAFPFAAFIPRALAATTGAALLVFAGRDELLVPSLPSPTATLSVLEAAVGAWLMIGARRDVAAWALLGFSILAGTLAAPPAILETAIYPGIAAYLILERRARTGGVPERAPSRALAAAIGTSFVVVAFTEKLAVPGIGMAVLDAHPGLDPLSLLGAPLPAEAFVRVAGLTEVLVGLLIATGVGGRLLPLGLLAPFLATVPEFGPVELAGHAPICLALVGVAAGTAPLAARNTPERATKRR
jgi:hypothetical protein